MMAKQSEERDASSGRPRGNLRFLTAHRAASPRWRSEIAALIVGLTTVASLWITAGTAAAASSTCGTHGNYFVVVIPQTQDGSNADGVQSNIEARSPALCSSVSTERFSLGTVLIGGNGGADGYAQIGWTRDTNLCCLRFFWQWQQSDGSTVHTGFWGSPSVGTRYNFKVTRLASDGLLHMNYLDPDQRPPCNQNGFCPETNFDPHSAWSGHHAEVFGEVNYPGNDMPGLAGAKAEFAQIQVRPLNTGWQNPASTWLLQFNDRPCYWHLGDADQPVLLRTWTDPVNHGTFC
jgi:hypothetical protein